MVFITELKKAVVMNGKQRGGRGRKEFRHPVMENVKRGQNMLSTAEL